MKSIKPLWLFTGIFICLALLTAHSITKKNTEEKLQTTIESHLLQIVNELKITLERHSYLPSLLANDSEIVEFLKTPVGVQQRKERQETINLSLELINNISGTTTIFLMDPKGKVVSSSNWAEKVSFISQNFSSEPYFKQASYNSLGRYFSSQSRAGERYYFFARSVQYENKVIGIIAAQIPLSDIAFNWTSADVDFIVTDYNGVVFLSNKKSWEMKAITKLDQNFTDANKQYRKQKISSLSNDKINLNYQGFQHIQLLNTKHLMLSQRMELANWDVRALSKYSIAKKEISRKMYLSAIIILLTTLLALLLLNRQNQRNKFREQAREQLEEKVLKRTQALKKSQEDLIQAAKMAALGQLSTGITHEINNPLTAIRSYADNAEQFLKKDQLNMVKSNLKEISKLTENMATITRQLKSFARKSQGELKAVNIETAIKNAISIVNSKIISSGTEIDFKINPENSSKLVLADEIWVSQILVNLISNAISATNANIKRKVWINISENILNAKHLYCIEIQDNGKGIDEANLEKIFEPFFTTKPTTKGLGLGLSISYNLARDMNGSLTARNHELGGALFTLCLPSANSDKQT